MRRNLPVLLAMLVLLAIPRASHADKARFDLFRGKLARAE
jgi:hypothetical protein